MIICRRFSCQTEIPEENHIELPDGLGSTKTAYYCDDCGRLHWLSGEMVFDYRGHGSFFVDGKVENKSRGGKVMSTFFPRR